MGRDIEFVGVGVWMDGDVVGWGTQRDKPRQATRWPEAFPVARSKSNARDEGAPRKTLRCPGKK
jgi:hypothetical protein